MDTIGIVGQGFVGGALREGMKHSFKIETYDKFQKEKSTTSSIEELCKKCRAIFVCVPTPMKKTGECDISIIESVIAEISQKGLENIVVIKSTIPPGTTRMLHETYATGFGLSGVLFNPEFLTEANAVNDFKNQDRIVVGFVDNASRSGKLSLDYVISLYQRSYPDISLYAIQAIEAELVKYVTNCFLATKVSFANEIQQICKACGADFDNVIEVAKRDVRLGQSHWKVPGPMLADDGSGKLLYGFGGSCFVKDINALMFAGSKLGVDPKVLAGVWSKNLEVRPERDWECLRGRAVSNKEGAD